MLDSLASKLLAISRVRPGSAAENWWRWIKRAGPALSDDECKALASYAIAMLACGMASSSALASNLTQATRQREEQMSFNLQYLAMQNTMNQESRSYTSVSNIMKTKHDTAKNTISNVH